MSRPKNSWVLEQELLSRGYDYRLTGTSYIREAVNMVTAEPTLRRVPMYKEVYPALAKAAQINSGAVERAMRYAVHKAEPGQTVGAVVYGIAAKVKAYED